MGSFESEGSNRVHRKTPNSELPCIITQKELPFFWGWTMAQEAYELCCKLHEGAAYALIALGDVTCDAKYANTIIDNVQFEDSLVAHHLLLVY